jgi:hypothetical protein
MITKYAGSNIYGDRVNNSAILQLVIDQNGSRFAGKLLPVLVIALKRNGAYAENI